MSQKSFNVLELPLPVRRSLRLIGEQFTPGGVEIWLFGSFARGVARPGSDLDLAYRCAPECAPALVAELGRALRGVPTIRVKDVVDLRRASAQLAREAVRGIPLQTIPLD